MDWTPVYRTLLTTDYGLSVERESERLDGVTRRYGLDSYGLVALALASLAGCTGENLSSTLTAAPDESDAVYLEGRISIGPEAQALDLAEKRQRPLLLIFAQENCTTCQEEAREFDAAYESLRDRLEILTVIIGADHEIADEWKTLFDVPWPVAYEDPAELFARYCPPQTPSSFLEIPGRGIVLRSESGPSASRPSKPTLRRISPGSQGYPRFYQRLAAALKGFETIATTDSFETVRSLVLLGALASVPPARVAQRHVEDLLEVAITDRTKRDVYYFYLVHRKNLDPRRVDFVYEHARAALS